MRLERIVETDVPLQRLCLPRTLLPFVIVDAMLI